SIVPNTSVATPASQQVFGYQAFFNTNPPAADTNVTITASDGRYSFSSVLRVLKPASAPVLSGVSVNPTSVVGGNPSTGTVTLSAPQSGNTVVSLSTPAPTTVATMPSSVTVPAGATSATFTVVTKPVSSQFNMNIFADLAGSPGKQALLIITAGSSPPPPSGPTLSALSVSPSSVVGGNPSTGTVTLTAAAPSGGAVVSLSDNSTATSVPASVTVAAGSTSASFTITTTSVTASTSSTISGTFGGVTRSAPMMVNPAASGQTATLTVSASGRSGERVTSSAAGINVSVGSSGSASVAVGASITLSVTNGRDAIWSGACSRAGSKRRTCTFT